MKRGIVLMVYKRALNRIPTGKQKSMSAMATPEDLRQYQLHLVKQGISNSTINATIAGLRFFFEVSLDRPYAMRKMSPVYKP